MKLFKILDIKIDKYFGWKIIKYIKKYDVKHHYRISFDVDDSFMWECVYINGTKKQICDIEYKNGKFSEFNIQEIYTIYKFRDIPKKYRELIDFDIHSKIIDFVNLKN